MIILLHGDHMVASRAELTRSIEESKSRGMDVRQLDGKTVDTLSLTQAVESSSLFGGGVFVVIEGLLTMHGKKERQATRLIDILKRSAGSVDSLLWEDKEISKTAVGLLGSKVTVRLFKVPPVIWELLDGIKPGNAVRLLALLTQVFARDAAELVFSMIVRRIRHLIMVRDGVTPEALQGWQAGRLTSQAKLFTMDKLLAMEKALLEIDVSIKTGTSPFPLAQQLELFIVDL